MDDSYEQMRVSDLQAECKSKGVDFRGKKADLVKRLRDLTAEAVKPDAPDRDVEVSEPNEEEEENVDDDSLADDGMKSDQDADIDSPNSDDDNADLEMETSLCSSVDHVAEPLQTSEEAICDVEQAIVIENELENGTCEDIKEDDNAKDISQIEAPRPEVDETLLEEVLTDDYCETPFDKCRSRKRHDHSGSRDYSDGHPSPPPRRRRSLSPECVIPEVKGFESVDTSLVHLNPYISDLNLDLSDDCLSSKISTDMIFRNLMASATGSHYIPLSNGLRVAYSFKITEVGIKHAQQCDDRQTDADPCDADDFDVRVGWTINPINNNYLPGERGSNSFAYCNNGERCAKSVRESYFESFGPNDTITCLASFAEDTLEMRFCKNGQSPDECAFKLLSVELGISPDKEPSTIKLYPQVAARQCAFELNFGVNPDKCELPDGYQWINDCSLKELGFVGTDKKEDYEVVMMIGLPGSGKSYESQKMIEQFPEKNYHVINFEHILSRLKMVGPQNSLVEKPLDERDKLLHTEQAVRCYNRLLEMAASRPRNYIIDRCNASRSVQRRVIGPFRGFRTRAMVVVPDDAIYQQQLEAHECNRNSLLEMKGSMSLPKSEDVDEIVFVKLNEQGAREQIERYNHEGYSFKRRSERSPRSDRYGGRRSPPWVRKGDYRSSESSQRAGRRESSSSRTEGYRFQPRRSSPHSTRDHGGNSSGGGYDYDRFYGGQRFGGSVGGHYGRQRRSISPPSRQSSGHQARQWGNTSGGPRSDYPFRPRHQYGSEGYRMRGMSQQRPYGMDYGGRMARPSFGGNRQMYGSPDSPMMRTQWDSMGMHRGPLLSHSNMHSQSSMGSHPSMGGVMPRQQHRMDNWHFSGRRGNDQQSTEDWPRGSMRSGGPPSDWRAARPMMNASGGQWSSRQDPSAPDAEDSQAKSSRERSPHDAGSKRRSTGSQKWPPSPEQSSLRDASDPYDRFSSLDWSKQRGKGADGQSGWSSHDNGLGASNAPGDADSQHWQTYQHAAGGYQQSFSQYGMRPRMDHGGYGPPPRSHGSYPARMYPAQPMSYNNAGAPSGQEWQQGRMRYPMVNQAAPPNPYQNQLRPVQQQPAPTQQVYPPCPQGYAYGQIATATPVNSSNPAHQTANIQWPASITPQTNQQFASPLNSYGAATSVTTPQCSAAGNAAAYALNVQRPQNVIQTTPQLAVAAGTTANVQAQYAAWAAAVNAKAAGAAAGQTATAPAFTQQYGISQAAITAQALNPNAKATASSYSTADATAAYLYAAQQQAATAYCQQQQQQQQLGQTAAARQVQPTSATTSANHYQQQGVAQAAGVQYAVTPGVNVTQADATKAAGSAQTTAAGAPSITGASATTAQTQPQLIDEPTAYAGYLSAGYDQATAKAMATAYVQQQQQYYQWHQQWAAAAAQQATTLTAPQPGTVATSTSASAASNSSLSKT